MNKQKKVLITTTYNEMGIIIDTKVEEVAQPEIIYCKDCGHRDDHGCCKYWKALAIGDIPIATDDNDFCSHAERRNCVFVER